MKKAAFIGFIFRGWRGGLPRAQRALAMTAFFARSAIQSRAGRPGGRPLRKRNKRCNGRATARVAPTEGYKECLAGGRTGASAPTGGVLMVPCAAGHMGPALQGIFVGQGPRALPGCATRSAGGVYRMCFKFVKKLSCLFGAVAVQCPRRLMRRNMRCIRIGRSGSRRFEK